MRTLFAFLTIFIITNSVLAQTSKTMEFDGLTRKYLEYVPSSYDGTQPFPIVLCLHGLGDNMDNFFSIGMNYVADTANFIVLTPEAVPDPNFGNAWNSGASYSGIVLNPDVDDVGFLGALIDTLIENYNVSVNNIFVMGFSMGGFMTNRLACELIHRFKAAASVAGTMVASFSGSPASAIPFCHFHGTADATVAYVNNYYGNDAEELVDYWVNIDNCDTIPVIDTIPDYANDGKTVVHFTYPNGDSYTGVEFYKVIGGDHEWLYLPNNDISYTFKIWEFFRKYKNSYPAATINKVKTDNTFLIYPNPTTNTVNIVSKNNEPINNIQIISLSGNTISNFNLNKINTTLNVKTLKQGIYMLKIYTANSCVTKKLIIK
jgi:polyhydroxybutyrate depolymerase